MSSELGKGPGPGQPPIGLLYNTISGKGREDGQLSKSAMDMFGELSVTSQFKVSLNFPTSGSPGSLEGWLKNAGLLTSVDEVTTYDFLCSSASLPGLQFNSYDEVGSRQGMIEKFPISRVHAPFELDFYVDSQYRMIRLFEEWINYINPINSFSGEIVPDASGSSYGGAKNRPDFYRLRYPDQYKRIISITKFERDFLDDPTKSPGKSGGNFRNQTTLTYRMIDAYPINISPIPVTYDGSVITKSRINFAYSRYVIERNQRREREFRIS
jgi:hypothetical protein